ncbi:hypothetical protein E6A55_31065 [Cupriavidus necator H16]|uniref:Uncharacterized protein n=1 Tax=Cupriavidus necator (strain ATCC 17699 / DSM 428 / KCTC 22496 / NCIMB 10442 / H16 / Stanier 337) TaxID=381666 RepID=A0AAE5ZMY3_CUPNH|nr:hypothetical protein E6A55_31065 [Cupriavidus necator H16]
MPAARARCGGGGGRSPGGGSATGSGGPGGGSGGGVSGLRGGMSGSGVVCTELPCSRVDGSGGWHRHRARNGPR